VQVERHVQPDDRTRREFRCSGCGFGAVALVPPLACPICRDANWEEIEPPALHTLSDQQEDGGHLTITRLGGSRYLITPPSEVDIQAGAALTEAVAGLAHARPDVVVDLTRVGEIDPEAARLLLRLGALARGAGGRLLVVCPRDDAAGFAFHELDPEQPAEIDRIEGPLGRALRRINRADRRRKTAQASRRERVQAETNERSGA
jgi:anti-anti-sigma regulatory factor